MFGAIGVEEIDGHFLEYVCAFFVCLGYFNLHGFLLENGSDF